MEKRPTKEKILHAAVNLFSERGYENVSMRDIAKMVGIKAASIYNHYPSKNDILKSMYAFYVQQHSLVAPTPEGMLRLAETESIQDVLTQLNYRFPPESRGTLERILGIAAKRTGMDEDSARFIQDHFFTFSKSILVPALNRMIELGKVEPFDVDGFVILFTYLAFGAAALNFSEMSIEFDQWTRILAVAFSLVKPIPPCRKEEKTSVGTIPFGDGGLNQGIMKMGGASI